jgi:hypothetical protein
VTYTKSTVTANYPPCLQREDREANCACLTRVRALNPFEHRSAKSRLFLRGHVSVLSEDEIKADDRAETQVHEETHDPDAEDEDKDEDDSTLPEG